MLLIQQWFQKQKTKSAKRYATNAATTAAITQKTSCATKTIFTF